MKTLYWTLIALFLAVPYSNQGVVAAFLGSVRSMGSSLQATTDSALQPIPAGRHGFGRAPGTQQVSAKLRYRSAFLIAGFRPHSLVLTFSGPTPGRDQVCKHFLDDIFHPPA